MTAFLFEFKLNNRHLFCTKNGIKNGFVCYKSLKRPFQLNFADKTDKMVYRNLLKIN